MLDQEQTENSVNIAPIVEYFECYAKGFDNARPIEAILEDLRGLGFAMTRNQFQNIYLREMRRTNHFVGPCGKGMFLVVTRDDAERAIAWYENRIAAERAQVQKLMDIRTRLAS
jgi:hypothetical protein